MMRICSAINGLPYEIRWVLAGMILVNQIMTGILAAGFVQCVQQDGKSILEPFDARRPFACRSEGAGDGLGSSGGVVQGLKASRGPSDIRQSREGPPAECRDFRVDARWSLSRVDNPRIVLPPNAQKAGFRALVLPVVSPVLTAWTALLLPVPNPARRTPCPLDSVVLRR